MFTTRNTLLTLVAAALFALPLFAAEPQPSTVRIGLITDGEIVRQSSFIDLIQDEARRAATDSLTIEFPEDARLHGNWDPAAISAAYDELIARTDLDVILAAGIAVANEACRRPDGATPVVVPFIYPGCNGDCTHSTPVRTRSINIDDVIIRDLRAFHDLVGFERLAILMDPSWTLECRIDGLLHRAGLTAVEVNAVTVGATPTGVGGVVASTAADAAYLMPMIQLDNAAFAELLSELTTRGIPTFSMLGEQEVLNGAFASINTRAVMASLARGTVLDILDVCEGRTLTGSEVRQLGGQLTLNMETARAVGFDPSWELQTRARLVHAGSALRDRPIDLESAVRRAIEANLDLAVGQRRLAANAETVQQARANYRPQLEFALSAVAIDENHAMGALGQYASSASGSLTLNQLIYSDQASAGIDIQKYAQQAREHDLASLRQDIAREAVGAYLNVMRTNALMEVRRDRVDLTSTNLELARLRRDLGSGAAAEVHRWEAELATSRAGLLEALANNRQSERQLSRLLDEPISTRWNLHALTTEEALAVLGGADRVSGLGGVEAFAELELVLVDESLVRAPELAALRTMIAAQERLVKNTERTSYLPTVGLQAEVSHILAKDETGGVDLGEFADLLPSIDDTSWNIGVRASVPVLTGGRNHAEREQAKGELHALRLDARSAEEKVSQRTLSALDSATASFSAIELRQRAADAAARTSELVRDAYARGSASILDVLDAQNSALNAELAARTSIYDFLEDWAEVRRSVAALDITAN